MRRIVGFAQKPDFNLDPDLLVTLKNCLADIQYEDSSSAAEGEFGVEGLSNSHYLNTPIRAVEVLQPSGGEKVLVFLNHKGSRRWSSIVSLLRRGAIAGDIVIGREFTSVECVFRQEKYSACLRLFMIVLRSLTR